MLPNSIVGQLYDCSREMRKGQRALQTSLSTTGEVRLGSNSRPVHPAVASLAEAAVTPGDSPQILEDCDMLLRPLLPALDRAIRQKSTVAVLSLWNPNRVVALLPAHLHLRWPGEIASLSLTPVVGILPF